MTVGVESVQVETIDAQNDTGETASKGYHFLEYSGTRQLAEDIWRIREIFGDQKISVYGVSYGVSATRVGFGLHTILDE